MVRKLTSRLTRITLLALAAACILLVAAINGANALIVRAQIDESLSLLMTSSGQLYTSVQEGSGEPARTNALPQVRAAALARVTSYCTIRLNRSGDIHEWKSNARDVYSDDMIADIVRQIVDGRQTTGRIASQAYRQEERAYGTLIVLIDVSAEIAAARDLLRITFCAGIALLLALCAGALLLIRRMMTPVQEAFVRQQRFVADASHEMKTPLAVISANADVLGDEIGEDNEALQCIRDEIRRTSEMVQSLLLLARLDARADLPFAAFDLPHALLEAALPLESLMFEKGKTLALNLPERLTIVGNEPLLRQLAVILLTNAMNYAAFGTEITLSLESAGHTCFLRVHNMGNPIALDDQKHLFDRFYRADASHNRQSGGSGLGLAIAQEIAALHGGKISVGSNEAAGTTFTVTLTNACG